MVNKTEFTESKNHKITHKIRAKSRLGLLVPYTAFVVFFGETSYQITYYIEYILARLQLYICTMFTYNITRTIPLNFQICKTENVVIASKLSKYEIT